MITIPNKALNADLPIAAKILAGVLAQKCKAGVPFSEADATRWFNEHVDESIVTLAGGNVDQVDSHTIAYLMQKFGIME